jgi:hypothetical protein
MLRDLSKSCGTYNDLSSLIYKKDSENLFSCSTKKSNSSFEPVLQEHINEFKNDQVVIKKNPIPMMVLEFIKGNEKIVKDYFGDIDKIYTFSKNFSFKFFAKIVKWLNSIVDFDEEIANGASLTVNEHSLLVEVILFFCKVSRDNNYGAKSELCLSVSDNQMYSY